MDFETNDGQWFLVTPAQSRVILFLEIELKAQTRLKLRHGWYAGKNPKVRRV
jgi:hypothetical protein